MPLRRRQQHEKKITRITVNLPTPSKYPMSTATQFIRFIYVASSDRLKVTHLFIVSPAIEASTSGIDCLISVPLSGLSNLAGIGDKSLCYSGNYSVLQYETRKAGGVTVSTYPHHGYWLWGLERRTGFSSTAVWHPAATYVPTFPIAVPPFPPLTQPPRAQYCGLRSKDECAVLLQR